MNSLLDALNAEFNITTTANGAKAYKSTESKTSISLAASPLVAIM